MNQNTQKKLLFPPRWWQGLLFCLGAVSASTILLLLLETALYNVNMVYMLVTLIATVWFGLQAGVVAAFLGFLCFDFFFIPPHYTFAIDAFQGWTAVFLYLVTALFANQVAGRARLGSQQAQQRAQETTSLYEVATAVITRIDLTEMLLTVLKKVNEALGTASCTLYLENDDDRDLLNEVLRIERPEQGNHFYQPDSSLATTVYRRQSAAFFSAVAPVPAGDELSKPGTDTTPELQIPLAYLPLQTGARTLGVMVVQGYARSSPAGFTLEEKRLIEVFVNHVALAVEHARLIRENAQVEALRESDKLKSALLASVSHELRTPLTSIKTFTENLMDREVEWTEEDREEFLGAISQETERLTQLVSNLLDLTRIEAGTLKPDFGWYYLPEIVEKVIARLRDSRFMESHPITKVFARDLPLARMDYLEIDQVLTNLLENAVKYSPEGSPIQVQVEVQPAPALKTPGKVEPEKVLVVKVLDEGWGIPTAQLERIFDKFYRVRESENQLIMKVPGTGIGLTIAKGIIEAHGGSIWAENRASGGAVFTFTLPVTPPDIESGS